MFVKGQIKIRSLCKSRNEGCTETYIFQEKKCTSKAISGHYFRLETYLHTTNLFYEWFYFIYVSAKKERRCCLFIFITELIINARLLCNSAAKYGHVILCHSKGYGLNIRIHWCCFKPICMPHLLSISCIVCRMTHPCKSDTYPLTLRDSAKTLHNI